MFITSSNLCLHQCFFSTSTSWLLQSEGWASNSSISFSFSQISLSSLIFFTSQITVSWNRNFQKFCLIIRLCLLLILVLEVTPWMFIGVYHTLILSLFVWSQGIHIPCLIILLDQIVSPVLSPVHSKFERYQSFHLLWFLWYFWWRSPVRFWIWRFFFNLFSGNTLIQGPIAFWFLCPVAL